MEAKIRSVKLKYTRDEVIARIETIHPGKFTYEQFEFTGVVRKSTLTCRVHGDFQTTPDALFAGKGCRECSKLRSGLKRRFPAELFLSDAKKLHGERYDYSLVNYETLDTKVEIVCAVHGSFYQTPEKHLVGRGCPSCAGKGKMTLKRFQSSATRRHGDKYDISKVTLSELDSDEKRITLHCKEHGEFKKNVYSFLAGTGCSKCARYGFNTGKPGQLYVLKFENVVKVGITNREIATRVHEINRSSGWEFNLVESYYFEDGEECLNVETQLLQELSEGYQTVEEVFSGSTECYLGVLLEKLNLRIRELRNE